MKISKFACFLCIIATGATGTVVRADDNPAQAAARIALAKALFDVSAQPATNAVPANSQQSKADAKARKKADEQAAKAAAAKAKQDAAQAAANAKAQPAPTATPPPPPANVTANVDTDQKAQAEKAALATAPAVPPVVAPAPAPQPMSMADTNYVGRDLGMKPIAAPALPISAGKQQRLQALLQKYQADKITPEEYHQQRAAILAEP